ncbi:unnamed protein product, partial [Nesidiocoris tenuis]
NFCRAISEENESEDSLRNFVAEKGSTNSCRGFLGRQRGTGSRVRFVASTSGTGNRCVGDSGRTSRAGAPTCAERARHARREIGMRRERPEGPAVSAPPFPFGGLGGEKARPLAGPFTRAPRGPADESHFSPFGTERRKMKINSTNFVFLFRLLRTEKNQYDNFDSRN